MTNNANQKRQPKGTENGGQFAPDVNAESTVVLADEAKPLSFDEWIEIQESEIETILRRIGTTDSNDEEIDGQAEIMDIQKDVIRRYKERIAELEKATAVTQEVVHWANASGRLQGLTSCAYAVDETIDTLTRWDGGSGVDPADVLAHLIEVREEIFAAASPELVEQWRGLEAKVREYEMDPDSSPLDDDEYEVARDERETVFRSIYEEAFAS